MLNRTNYKPSIGVNPFVKECDVSIIALVISKLPLKSFSKKTVNVNQWRSDSLMRMVSHMFSLVHAIELTNQEVGASEFVAPSN